MIVGAAYVKGQSHHVRAKDLAAELAFKHVGGCGPLRASGARLVVWHGIHAVP